MKAKGIVKIAGAIAVTSVFVLIFGWRAYSSHEIMTPSDDTIIGIFQAHRGEIERLRQLATDDMHEASFFSEANISSALSASRRNEYKRLLKLSPGLQVGTNYDGTVRFIFASAGRAISSGWAKGIEFIPDTAKVIGTPMGVLDDSAKLPEGVYLRKLEPRWFIFFQRDE